MHRHPTSLFIVLLVLACAMFLRSRTSPPASRRFARIRRCGRCPLLAVASRREARKHFVDAARGDDAAAGSRAAPWKTLAHALRQLEPGDTLYLRARRLLRKACAHQVGHGRGAHHDSLVSGRVGRHRRRPARVPESPGHELGAVPRRRRGRVRLHEKLPHAAEPARAASVPARAWEPMWGIEEERPFALGHFADSMVPLHGYRIAADLRSDE